MSLDDTPIKSPIYSYSQQQYINRAGSVLGERTCPPSSENRRRMIASKSMYNLNTQKLPTARQLFHSSSKDSLRSSPSTLDSQRSPLSAHSVYSFFPPRSEDTSPTLVEEPASAPASPTKRTAAVAFASMRSSSDERVQTAPAALPMPQVQRPAASARTATAPPRYNMEDEDSLPSPFIKKKPSILNLGGGKSATRTSSVPNTRTLRPSTSRHSLLSAKTVVGRAMTNMKSAATTDEQGRLTSDKRSSSASTLS